MAWRFAAASLDDVALAMGADGEEVARDCEVVRQRRFISAGWRQVLWRIEYGSMFEFRAGPWRD